MADPRSLDPDDPRVTWEGAISVERTDTGCRAWRLPHQSIDLFPGEDLRTRARAAAGVRLVFETDSTILRFRFDSQGECSPVDIIVDGQLVSRGVNDASVESLPPRFKNVEVWLPHTGEVVLRAIEIDAVSTVRPARRGWPRWIAYGSSITQGTGAPSPARTWPAVVARTLHLDLLCLGFGGQALLDPMVARLIRDTSAAVITVCAGINTHNQGSHSPRTFIPALLGFLATIRDGHPGTAILVISPIVSPSREETPNILGRTLQQTRADVSDAVWRLQAAGDDALFLVDGLEVLNSADEAHLPDGLHPDERGNELIAHRIGHKITASLRQCPPPTAPVRSGPRFYNEQHVSWLARGGRER